MELDNLTTINKLTVAGGTGDENTNTISIAEVRPSSIAVMTPGAYLHVNMEADHDDLHLTSVEV